MALIDCPECGQKISDTASHCIHCGVKINVCPECKTISLGTATFCSVCGYNLAAYVAPAQPQTTQAFHPLKPTPTTQVNQNFSSKPAAPNTSSPANSVTNVQELYDDWSRAKKVPDGLLHRWIYWLTISLGLALWVIAVVKLASYMKGIAQMSTFEQYMETFVYEVTFKKIKSMFWVGTIIEILAALILQAQELYMHLSISRWLPTYNKEYNSTIAKALATKSDLYVGKAETFAIASWLTQHPEKRAMRIGTSIASAAIHLIGEIVSVILLINFMEEGILASLQVISEPDMATLFIGIVIFAVPSIIVNALESRYKKSGKAWLKQYYR